MTSQHFSFVVQAIYPHDPYGMAWRGFTGVAFERQGPEWKGAIQFQSTYISTGLAASMNGDASDTLPCTLILHILAVSWNIIK
jgi:hypothetical protein